MMLTEMIVLFEACANQEAREVAPTPEDEKDVYLFTDGNPSSTTYGKTYDFVLRKVSPQISRNADYVIFLQEIQQEKPILLNFFEPWCATCMKELPDLEKVAQENHATVFGFSGDYSHAGTKDAAYIETTISYPIFHGDYTAEKYMQFLHALDSDKKQVDPSVFENNASGQSFQYRVDKLEKTVDTYGLRLDMPMLPKTLFVYQKGETCSRLFMEDYDSIVKQTMTFECPKVQISIGEKSK